MRSKFFSVVLLVALVVGAALGARMAAPGKAAACGSRFSAVTLEPDAAAALRAQGKQVKLPFPNSANKGRKFNPVGDTVPALATAAEQNVLVLFVKFSNEDATEDPPPGGPATRLDLATYFDTMLFGTVYDPPEYASYAGHPTDRTLYNYYQAVSYGTVEVKTKNMPSTLGWLSVPHPYEYYCQADGIHDNGFGWWDDHNAQTLVVDAIEAADPYVDFSQYAVDGVVPNLFVVHAGTGAEWSGAPDVIWSHSWDLSEGTPYAAQGGYIADGVKINNYAMMPEVGGDLTNYRGLGVTGPFPPTVGVYAHEYGHVLGLPDQYDYGYESEGTGNFSLMAGGSWNRYPIQTIFNGNSPAWLDAWSAYRLGFVTPDEITDAEEGLALPPLETSAQVYKMVVPNSGGKEYFLFENRQNIGFDQGLQYRYYDASGRLTMAPMHGLAVYHIDETGLTRNGWANYWRCNEAENWKEFRSEGAKKAWTGDRHYAISLIQADDQWGLEHGYNRGDPGDLYPGTSGNTSLTSYTLPNTSNYYFWGGSEPKFGYSGVTVENIEEAVGGDVTADFSFVPWAQPSKR